MTNKKRKKFDRSRPQHDAPLSRLDILRHLLSRDRNVTKRRLTLFLDGIDQFELDLKGKNWQVSSLLIDQLCTWSFEPPEFEDPDSLGIVNAFWEHQPYQNYTQNGRLIIRTPDTIRIAINLNLMTGFVRTICDPLSLERLFAKTREYFRLKDKFLREAQLERIQRSLFNSKFLHHEHTADE